MRIALLLLCFTTVYPSLAQFSWFKEIPGAGYVGAESLSIDPDNNVLVVGNFENGATIMGHTYAGKGSFLLKLTKDGTHIWHKIIRYGAGDFWFLSNVATDGDGNSYITATFPQTATVDGSTVSSPEAYNNLVSKFNNNGELQWTKVIRNVQEIFDMKVNDDGNILLYAHHYGTVTIDHITLQVGPNSFGVMLNTSGTVQWAKAIGDPTHYTTWPKACAIDNAGNAYFHGLFSGTLSLDGKQGVSGGGNFDFFVAKVNDQGICQWISTAERKIPQYETANPPNGLIIERGALQVDDQQNVYMGGSYMQGIKIGSFTLQDAHSFVAQFNAAGVPVWVNTRPSSNGTSTVDDIAVRNGLVYVSGIQPSQLYFSVYTTAGSVIEAEAMLPMSADIASGLDIDSENRVYMSGRQYDVHNLQGFIFKYQNSNPPPAEAGPVDGPDFLCISENTIQFSTDVITRAESYEWEISFNTNQYLVSTPTSEFTLTLSDFQITGNFSIRVRGRNVSGPGTWSNEKPVTIEEPLNSPTLLTTCAKIYMEDVEASTISWYFNDVAAPEYGDTNQSITPREEGDYYAVLSNACGSATSNTVDFSPVELATLKVPNIITPNDDPLNQKFVVDEKLESPQVIIYNRWGKTIYTSEKYNNTWDGENYAVGVYFYQLNSACVSAPIQGTLTIAR